MKQSGSDGIFSFLGDALGRIGGGGKQRETLWGGPIRGELLGTEHLIERARVVAREQKLAQPGHKHRPIPLPTRLAETNEILHAAKARLEVDPELDVGPAGEWLLDNFHVINEQILEVRESLPRGYYRELPVLANGPLAGHPRVFELATTLISHTEGRLDLPLLELFVSAFQEGRALTIGELWTIPSMLRLGLLENVRRMALRTVQRLDEVDRADAWVARVHTASLEGEANLNQCLSDFMAQSQTLTPVFVSRFLIQLRHSSNSTVLIARLEHWIAEEALGAEEADAQANQRLAITQMVMANSITSLRAIAGFDWQSFVERQSAMNTLLSKDPAGAFSSMTFATRDHYRHVVERIAKRTRKDEAEVAAAAVAAAQAAQEQRGPEVASHVGYHLVDDGLPALEAAFRYRPRLQEKLHRFVLRHPSLLLFGGVATLTLGLVALVCWVAVPSPSLAWLAIALLTLLPISDVVIAAANQLVTVFLPPRLLPKLDLTDQGGIPNELRTLVVVPILFGSLEAVQEALETLEVQFLANREANINFALLGDFTDASTETLPSDEAIVAAASQGVRALNERYAESGGPFHLFHRPRRWNSSEGCWMGWERKRGKLAELNAFLRGGARNAFSTREGDEAWLGAVRYVITLDSDTVLPPTAAVALVGAMAHPLNRAVYDPLKARVVRGYGILQPRVVVSLPSANASRFAAIYSGHPGVDPYTTAVSDLYQDLFGEGSYTGKGIYDVDAFERATHGRFPEGTVLSHDLIEGSFARAGLATDINVHDDYPSRYLPFTRRKHRWIRGDWQLLPWLGGRVPGPGQLERNRLSLLSRWKIFDNLRRSLVDLAQMALLIAGWTVLPGSALRWTAFTLLTVAAPWIISLLLATVRPPFDRSWRTYYAALGHDALTSLKQVGLTITFLPHQAAVAADAIVRTLYRLFVSRRRLLQWQTAQQVERADAGGIWRKMWQAPAVAVGIGAAAFTYAFKQSGIAGVFALAPLVLPLVALWLMSPAVARALGAPPRRPQRTVPTKRRDAITRYALAHWRFFERFVADETKWLAPDNFQETPEPVIAMRTSPTNVGLQLLSTVSAHDLGFISLEGMTDRLEKTFTSIEQLPKYKGHLYNWYDLHTLRVLEPAYVSTVDSGNLAGHLIALRQACLCLVDEAVTPDRLWSTLDTALQLAAEGHGAPAATAPPALPKAAVTEQEGEAARLLDAARAELSALRAASPASNDTARLLAALRAASVAASAFPANPAGSDGGWIEWAITRLQACEPELLADGQLHPAPVSLRTRALNSASAAHLVQRLEALAARAYAWALGMDFRFLYDPTRKLFGIGFHEQSRTLDASSYDLLASESRLASFVAVAKGDAPVEHWFRLGRTLTHAGGETALVSWSGSMFEYLMPPLVMASHDGTLLGQTHLAAVRRQIGYGTARGVPWGVSESAYNVRDRHFTYQYRAFGVPDLGLKRGLARDLVVAPYASAMAVMFEPARALANLAELEQLGALGPYGLRDALDYTRPAAGQPFALVHNYMAHHIGMAFVAFTNALTNDVWPRRFHADPLVRASELLLHERIPRRLTLRRVQPAREEAEPAAKLEDPAERIIEDLNSPEPHVALLGRWPYTIMVSHCGAGYSRYEDQAVTRWRADGTSDNSGQFIYVANLTDNRVWSATHQPVCAPPDQYRAVLATDRVTFYRTDGDIETRTEIATSSEDAAEIRRVTVKNIGDRTIELELTSYGEIVLGRPDADRAHPAFANLFVQTEWHEWCTAITATRRPRSPKDKSLWCVHVVDADKDRPGFVTCETDRARFLGRGRSPREPAAVMNPGPLAGTTGSVLDPIFALRTQVRLAPGHTASVAFTTLVANTRERAFALADRYNDPHGAQRALDLAWTATQAELRDLGVTAKEAGGFQDVAAHLFYATPSMRAPDEELRRNRGSQPALWSHGISGDWPILLATIDGVAGLPTLRQLLSAHSYWRRHGMTVDLVVLNMQTSGYLQELGDKINAGVFAAGNSEIIDKPGGVFIRRRELLAAEDLLMLRATARVHVTCDGRSLGRIIENLKAKSAPTVQKGPRPAQALPVPLRKPERSVREELVTRAGSRAHQPSSFAPGNAEQAAMRLRSSFAMSPVPAAPRPPTAETAVPLMFNNGIGGLMPDGRYRIDVAGELLPPAPWSNVIAGPRGGFVISERGGGFCWAENSYFFRLTPWNNDPVTDQPGEVIYIRDEDTADIWCATPAPVRNEAAFAIHHGAGFSTFEQTHLGIETKLTVSVADAGAVKVSILTLTNTGSAARRLTVTSFVEWTLGVMREHTQHQVQTTFNGQHNAVTARNFFDPQFASWVAFSASTAGATSHSGNRRSFIGRNGSLAAPAALVETQQLDNATGGALDPCAALRSPLQLAPGETQEIVFLLGAVDGEAAADETLLRLRNVKAAKAAVADTVEAWKSRLSVIKVQTPDPAFNAMLNHWALYQALACRMWARSALYQSSGAYGFRDQLQDVMAFVYAEPALARAHILLAASRQFVEGDVQHWWHPQSGRGVRTRFSDDLAWLAYVLDHYVRVTGDAGILQEQVPFLSMRLLGEDEHEIYDLPSVTTETASLYEHALRALRRAFTKGSHGLPLIGIGDWNDGMSRVGVEGRGESVWLAWFLATTARNFSVYADAEVCKELTDQAAAYVAAVEAHGWDGEWYRRAYFDDGAPLGSSTSDECQIDSIAQSWSVISGAGLPARQEQAMKSFETHLVDEQARILLLLDPPFDKTSHDPGYIKGYLPGVRENGAQYTHAALWAVLATALRGDGDRAFELFQMLNPLLRTQTAADVAIYKVEPYVIAADVYTAEGHRGRGGWTWYTGSASWMYRVGLEAILGFGKNKDTLTFTPRVPRAWTGFSVEYRHGSSVYAIEVDTRAKASEGEDVASVKLDGRTLVGMSLPLVNDGARHDVRVRVLPQAVA